MFNPMDPLGEDKQISDAITEEPGSQDSDMMDSNVEDDLVASPKMITYDGKVQKELLEVGEGPRKPKMHYLASIIYSAYFYNHDEFESSNGQVVEIALGDIAWPEGLWKGIVEMRKGEKAKIKIKKKYGFGRRENVDKLRFPKGYEEEGSENRQRIMTKGIIYEVKLIDWVERIDVEADGNFMKTFVQKPKKQWETPKDSDEVKLNMKIYQEESQILFEKRQWETSMTDPEFTLSQRKVLESLKQGEKSITVVKREFVNENDQDLVAKLGGAIDKERDLKIEAELEKLVKVEDWFKDGGSTLKKTLRKGKGPVTSNDSIIKLRMKITVNNDNVITNNYKEEDPVSHDDQAAMDEDQKQEIVKDASLFTFQLDRYTLPSLVRKVVKSMKKNEVCELVTARTDKLRNNFANEHFDQYKAFKDGDKVSFLMTLVDSQEVGYFYQLKIAEKLERLLHLKGVAGQFFKVGDTKKAARLYQRINGYFQFGDYSNNYSKEDESAPEFQKNYAQVQAMKQVCFMNLAVCKSKMKEWDSVINVTDQILEMDPRSVKALYFRGKAHLELEEYDKSIESLGLLLKIDPSSADGRNELARAKKIRKDFLDKETKKFSKMFGS